MSSSCRAGPPHLHWNRGSPNSGRRHSGLLLLNLSVERNQKVPYWRERFPSNGPGTGVVVRAAHPSSVSSNDGSAPLLFCQYDKGERDIYLWIANGRFLKFIDRTGIISLL